LQNNFFFKKEGFSKTLSNINICVFVNQNGKITNRDVREMFKLSNRAALDEINKLIELQLLKPKGKALHYKNGMCP
jgi:predicted HTH transcriptional regulator